MVEYKEISMNCNLPGLQIDQKGAWGEWDNGKFVESVVNRGSLEEFQQCSLSFYPLKNGVGYRGFTF